MKEKKPRKIKVTPSSGNVFTDMGLANPEERLLKARLALLVNNIIEDKGWTQIHTANVLGITQPDVSDLSRGRLKNFSVERLLQFLSKLERKIIITVTNEEDKRLEEAIIIPAHSALAVQAKAV